jgi:ERCC4-type nuclease
VIHVDDRAGSKELLSTIQAMHVDATLARIEFGDFVFDGHGPHGPCSIAIERKQLRDLLCCIQTGRFAAHQLPGMLEAYDYCYLIVEGCWTVDAKTLELSERHHGGWHPVKLGPSHTTLYRELDNYLNSIATMSACRVKTSNSPAETVMQICDLYHWWQKPWGEHSSLKVLRREPARFAFFKPNLTQSMAACLPGIGYERSAAVAMKFRTPVDMVLATPADWQSIPGVGKGIAAKVVKVLYEGDKGDTHNANR